MIANARNKTVVLPAPTVAFDSYSGPVLMLDAEA